MLVMLLNELILLINLYCHSFGGEFLVGLKQ